MNCWALWALLNVAAPTESAALAEPTYAQTQAQADVETIVSDSSKAYLQARARLESNPEVAAPALRARIDAVPAPGPSEQRRLLGVLAELHRPEDLPRFAKALRRAVVNADPGAALLEVAHPWRVLLLEQGPRATAHLQELVGDDALPPELRAALLTDWVGLQPADRAGEMVVLVGRGQAELERELRRTLADRAKRDPAAAQSVITATDAALDAALGNPPNDQEAARLPALLRFRARVGKDDGALVRRLSDVATNPEARFGARVAAVRGLGALDADQTTAPLRALAQAQLHAATTGSQQGEILGWLSVQGLPKADAGALSTSFALRDSDAPRLASLGYEHAPLDQAHVWLPTALQNPWPQVRQAALERVSAPCADSTIELLSGRGRATGDGGDTDRATARAAISGLGRCASAPAKKALRSILVNADGDIELRAEAARQLARLGETKPVVNLLRSRPEAALARRLAAALRHAPASDPKMDETLCAYVELTGPVARAAADTLRTHHRGDANPCAD
ncbi:MAG: hypothetical protein ACRBN8_06690 [Nannocystales bacterium]